MGFLTILKNRTRTRWVNVLSWRRHRNFPGVVAFRS